jgi:hypothetical protein
MRLQVDPARLTETAVPLRDAAAVAREVHDAGASLAAHLATAGSEPLRQAAGGFLTAWGRGLGAVADRGETLARMLELAAASYGDANEQLRRRAGQADPGGAP